MKKKILMILGGSRYVLPLIEVAHELNVFVITCDYLPNNIAHKYSDLYLNISIIDKEKVLEAAKRFNIDGITSFACDPGVTTAAYVAEKLNLPTSGPYESICILQNKGLFREFLRKNGFNVPKAKSYSNLDDALGDIDEFVFPVIVKPTDSAGSKGVTKVEKTSDLKDAINYAFSNSLKKEIIIEEFIEKLGCSSDSDCYSVDGKLVFVSFSNQYFDEKSFNPFTPAGFVWPSMMDKKYKDALTNDIQRAITLLKMKTSIYNVETRVSKIGKPYIMEISPRGGGNRIAEMLKYHQGVDLIKRHVKDCLGIPTEDELTTKYENRIGELILHSNNDGFYDGITIGKELETKLLEKDIWVNTGDRIEKFTGANKTIGTIVFNMDANDDFSNFKNNITVREK